MVKSNKMLVSLLIFIMIAGAAVHWMLFNRYRAGVWVSEEQIKSTLFDSKDLTAIKHVVLRGMQNIRIIRAEKERIDMNRNMAGKFVLKLTKDTLFLTGDTAIYQANRYSYGPIQLDQEIDLHLPESTTISAFYTIFQAMGSKIPATAPSYQVNMCNSRLQLGEYNFFDKTPSYFNRVLIEASRHSEVRFTKTIDSLRIHLQDAALIEDGGILNFIEVQADEHSTITLSGASMSRIGTSPHP